MANAEAKSCTCWDDNIIWVSDMQEHVAMKQPKLLFPLEMALNAHMTVHGMMHPFHVYGHREFVPGSPGTSVAAFTGKGVR